MNKIKRREIWMSGFALFSLFFGAGNLILPPNLGVQFGQNWWLVLLGFAITAVIIPILGIFAHAKVQGTLFDLAKSVSKVFSSFYCVVIYVIAIVIPAPRTASVTHEMSIQPFFEISSLWTSSIYFLLVFVFVINRSKILSFIGKMLTPIIVLILLAIIIITIFSEGQIITSTLNQPFFKGFIEGYQTFDAIGGVVVGAFIVVSLNLRGYKSYEDKRKLITQSGIIAGSGLFLIYGGLIFSGAYTSNSYAENISRTQILSGISNLSLGNLGTTFLSVLVALACFTTAVGVVTGASDYIKGICNDSKKAYMITATISCVIGALVGHYEVKLIIDIALPALMFIYPITIMLIFLNVLSKKWTSPFIFKVVVITTFLFSVPDFLQFFVSKDLLSPIQELIPFSNGGLGWLLPALCAFLLANIYAFTKKTQVIK